MNKGNTIAKSCRVLLQDAYQGGAGTHEFDRQHVAVPLQFAWAPKEARPQQPNIPAGGEDRIDLGVIAKGAKGVGDFFPRFYWTPRRHEHSVPKGCKVRYFVSAVADNCASSEAQILEVSWDGQWDDDPRAMGSHLRVVEVNTRCGTDE